MKKISISNILFDDNLESAKILYKNNINYIEVAPTKIINWEDDYFIINNKIKNYLNMLNNYNITPIMMQSIFFGISYNLYTDTENFINHFKKVIDVSNMFGIKFIVFGSPRNRFKPEFTNNIFIDVFSEIADYDKSINICLETNPTVYNTNFITNEKEKNILMGQISNLNILSHIDTSSLIINDDYVDLSFFKTKTLHISSPFLKEIKNDFFIENKEIIFDNVEIISLECSDKNNIDNTISNFIKLLPKIT